MSNNTNNKTDRSETLAQLYEVLLYKKKAIDNRFLLTGFINISSRSDGKNANNKSRNETSSQAGGSEASTADDDDDYDTFVS